MSSKNKHQNLPMAREFLGRATLFGINRRSPIVIINWAILVAKSEWLTKMKKVPSFLINCLLIFSCEAQEKTESQRFLEEFDDSFPLFKNGRWEVLVEWFDERELTINATKNSGDTLLSVRVHKHLISKDSVIVSFIDASRIFNQNASMIDYQRLDQNLDIMYWYKFDSINEDKKSFIAGKYYYQYLEGFLSKKQRDLFLKHSDSLKLVKGDNLTEIPEY